jgi:ketosteroid isomerase-like protein
MQACTGEISMSNQIADQIKALEDERIRALIAADYATLAAMLADDLVHIHANGSIEDKAAYLAAIEAKLDFLKIERPSFKVRSFGSIAVSTGTMDQTVRVKGPGMVVEMQAAVTQVWVRSGDDWLLTSFQATRIEQH